MYLFIYFWNKLPLLSSRWEPEIYSFAQFCIKKLYKQLYFCILTLISKLSFSILTQNPCYLLNGNLRFTLLPNNYIFSSLPPLLLRNNWCPRETLFVDPLFLDPYKNTLFQYFDPNPNLWLGQIKIHHFVVEKMTQINLFFYLRYSIYIRVGICYVMTLYNFAFQACAWAPF